VLKGYIPCNFKRDGGKETYELLRDADGELMRREPILGDDLWARLQEALKRPGRPNGKRPDASPLLHIAVCGNCGAWLHYNAFTRTYKGKQQHYRYYNCSAQCGEKGIDATELEQFVDKFFTIGASEGGTFGDLEIIEHVTIPGHDYADELADVEYRISSLDQDAADYDERHATLRAERKAIKARPTEPTVTRDEPTGILLKQYWPTLSVSEKRAYLLRCVDFRIHARRNSDMGDPLDLSPTGDPRKVIGALRRKQAAQP
jgi:hypothetical protein